MYITMAIVILVVAGLSCVGMRNKRQPHFIWESDGPRQVCRLSTDWKSPRRTPTEPRIIKANTHVGKIVEMGGRYKVYYTRGGVDRVVNGSFATPRLAYGEFERGFVDAFSAR